MVIGVWLLLRLGEIVPTSIFDLLRHLTTGAVSIYFPRSATPSATVRLRQSKMYPARWGAVVLMAFICLKVPPSVCLVHTLLVTLRLGMLPPDTPVCWPEWHPGGPVKGYPGSGEVEAGLFPSVSGGPGLLPGIASGQNGATGPEWYLLEGPQIMQDRGFEVTSGGPPVGTTRA